MSIKFTATILCDDCDMAFSGEGFTIQGLKQKVRRTARTGG